MDQSTLASTITNLAYVQNLSFCYVACLTLLAYDFFLLIPREIQYIWDSPWSVIKGLYFVQRYIPFLDVLLITLPLFIPDIAATTRILQNHSGFFILALGMAASEAILTLRAVAACGSSRAVKITLTGIFIVLWTAVAVILAVGFAGGDGIICVFNGKKQCTVFHESNLLAVPFALLLLYDIMLVGMMSASAWRNYRRGPASNLSTALYRDGLIYYLYILVLTTTIVILIILHIGQNQNFLAVVAELIPLLLRIVHSAITSRVVIDIRTAIFADRAIREGGSKASSTDILLSKS